MRLLFPLLTAHLAPVFCQLYSVCSKRRRLDGGEQYQFEYNAFVSFFGATGDVLLRIYILHWDVK